MSTLPQQTPINQYLGDGATVTFNYNFLILMDSDMTVYVTAPLAAPNPATDFVSQADYTITGANNPTGGTITFNTAPAVNAVITIMRNMQLAISTNFASAQNFNGANLDSAFQRIGLLIQQMQGGATVNNVLMNPYGVNGAISRCLQYQIDSYLPTETNVILPNLTLLNGVPTNNLVWVGLNGSITTAQLFQGGDATTLQQLLASQVMGADGASLIGYYNNATSSGETVDTALTNLIATQNANLLPSGMMVDFGGTSAPTGWLLCDGSAVSRATYAALFAAIGTTWGAGNGTTTFNIPDMTRRVSLGSGGTATSPAFTGTTPGSTGGEETHQQLVGEVGAHHHTVGGGAQQFVCSSSGSVGSSTGTDFHYFATTDTINSGGATPMNVMQLGAVVTKIIKI